MSILKVGMYASQIPTDPIPTEQNYLTFSSDNPFSIKFNQKTWDGVLEYSTDKQNWTEWDASEVNSVNNTLYLRGTGNSYITGFDVFNDPENMANYAVQINATSGVACSGSIMTLLDHVNPDTVVMGEAAFACMFFDCTSLISAPALPATTLTANCYMDMFHSCTNLATAPELPATVLAEFCYMSMFFDCISLTSTPVLPATILAEFCYSSMFYGCTSLTVASELPATILTEFCYIGMFYDCTSLTVAPDLPATTLTANCYTVMFQNCINLISAPVLPATQLAEHCYDGMFKGCKSLTITPDLPATTLTANCYYSMFEDCTGIKISTTQSGIYQTPWRIPTVGSGTTATEWSSYMLRGTGGTFTDDPSINRTYYQAG